MNDRLAGITDKFEEVYGSRKCRLFRAPGRVNLIGEHTDYNDGYVFPMAIDMDVVIAARGRSDRLVRLHSMNFDERSQFSLDAIERDEEHFWSNYVRGVALYMSERFPSLCGGDVVIEGNVPIGSGLSSSAAVEVVTALALLDVNGLSMDRSEMALLCQRAENEFVGNRCGVMDQLSSVFGQRGKALFIDCRSLDVRPVPIPEEVVVVICDTMKRRELLSSEYNARRAECEDAARILGGHLPGVSALRDVSCEDFEAHKGKLPQRVRMRAEHVIYENERVEQSVEALHAGDLAKVGDLMAASHESLRDKYQVSCAELDLMVAIASRSPGCIGARMTGAGFGGCTVNVVERDRASGFCEAVGEGYHRETGIVPEIYTSVPSEGASAVDDVGG
jgi:galactokinase